MLYKIKNTALSEPWFERIVAETLDMYSQGLDLCESPLRKAGRRFAHNGRWHWTLNVAEDMEAGLAKREEKLIELYESIKKNGYNGSIIAAWFDKRGNIHLYDGFHRLAVMKYLGMEELVNVGTVWSKKDYDFPLVDMLIRLPRVGFNSYLPVDDDRLRELPVDRKDSPERLKFILENLVGGVGSSVLDIGCSEGYFSIELAKLGYAVTAIDKNPGKVAVTRYLSILNNLDIKCVEGNGEDYLRASNGFDNVLYMSVFHNTIWDEGIVKAITDMRKLYGKAKRVFFEVPDNAEAQWKDKSNIRPLYGFTGSEFEDSINDITGMSVITQNKIYRPMYVLDGEKTYGKSAALKPIPAKKWEKDNVWEANWWKGATDTYGEQALQQMYAGYMRLTEYAEGNKFNMRGKRILDIGGGPVSLLLRCENVSRATVVDPCRYPKWVADRYKMAGIEYRVIQAENIDYNKEFDEVWIYNVLQHVRDPRKIAKNAIRAGKLLRVFEPIEIGIFPGHPHNLSVDGLDEAYEKHGIVHFGNGEPGQGYYYGVFNYEI